MLTKSESTISRILAAAGGLFTEKNYADVTMDQIAEASEVTKGALYHHFASKEELYLAMMHADLADKRTQFSDAIAGYGDCRARLRRLTLAFLSLPHTQRDLIRLVRRDLNTFAEPERTELVRAYQRSLPELIEKVVRDGMRDGELAAADPRLLSWSFVALVEVTLSRYADEFLEDIDAKLEHVLNLFFRGAARVTKGANE